MAWIQSLAQKLPYALGAAKKKKKKKNLSFIFLQLSDKVASLTIRKQRVWPTLEIGASH